MFQIIRLCSLSTTGWGGEEYKGCKTVEVNIKPSNLNKTGLSFLVKVLIFKTDKVCIVGNFNIDVDSYNILHFPDCWLLSACT